MSKKMSSKEISDLLSRSNAQVFALDHKHKTDIQRKDLNAITDSVTKSLTRKKNVTIVVVEHD